MKMQIWMIELVIIVVAGWNTAAERVMSRNRNVQHVPPSHWYDLILIVIVGSLSRWQTIHPWYPRPDEQCYAAIAWSSAISTHLVVFFFLLDIRPSRSNVSCQHGHLLRGSFPVSPRRKRVHDQSSLVSILVFHWAGRIFYGIRPGGNPLMADDRHVDYFSRLILDGDARNWMHRDFGAHTPPLLLLLDG